MWFRLDPGITAANIQARMPVKWVHSPYNDEELPEPYVGEGDVCVNASARRFRREAGLMSWDPAEREQATIDSMDSLRSTAQRSRNIAVERNLNRAEEGWLETKGTEQANRSSADIVHGSSSKLARHESAWVD